MINFRKLVGIIPEIDFSDTQDILEFEERLVNCVSQNTKQTNRKHRDKAWWSPKIKQLWDIKQAKQKIYNRHKTLFTATELKKAVSCLKNEIRNSK